MNIAAPPIRSSLYFFVIIGIVIAQAHAADIPTLAPVQVIESGTDRLGIAGSANEGLVTREQLDARPTYRSGEILEFAPGLIVTQHSGDGKANQYFLRGFNLDHGTDLAITVDGMPVNLRSHGHGQGYSDLNFLIPELVSGLYYKKGPYYADEGDFVCAVDNGAGGSAFSRSLRSSRPSPSPNRTDQRLERGRRSLCLISEASGLASLRGAVKRRESVFV